LEIGLSFTGKRDRVQIIADILSSCSKSPKTQTYIRRQTSISYSVLQNSIGQLLKRKWLRQVNDGNGQVKLALTEKGLNFLEKWVQIQKLVGLKTKHSLKAPNSKIQSLVVHTK
jgi:predicted transcriptional regulator